MCDLATTLRAGLMKSELTYMTSSMYVCAYCEIFFQIVLSTHLMIHLSHNKKRRNPIFGFVTTKGKSNNVLSPPAELSESDAQSFPHQFRCQNIIQLLRAIKIIKKEEQQHNNGHFGKWYQGQFIDT